MRKKKLKPHRKAVPRLPAVDQSKSPQPMVERTADPPVAATYGDKVFPAQTTDLGEPDPVQPSPPIDQFVDAAPVEELKAAVAQPPTIKGYEPGDQIPAPPGKTHDEFLLEDLKSRGIEQSWVPAALLYKGKLVANMPRSGDRQLKGYEIEELVRIVIERGDGSILQAEEVEQLLGWKPGASMR